MEEGILGLGGTFGGGHEAGLLVKVRWRNTGAVGEVTQPIHGPVLVSDRGVVSVTSKSYQILQCGSVSKVNLFSSWTLMVMSLYRMYNQSPVLEDKAAGFFPPVRLYLLLGFRVFT